MGLEDGTQVGSKYLYLLSHLASPKGFKIVIIMRVYA